MDWTHLHRITNRFKALSECMAKLSNHFRAVFEKSSGSPPVRKTSRILILLLSACAFGNLAYKKATQLELSRNQSSQFPKFDTLNLVFESLGLAPLDAESAHVRKLLDGLPRNFAVVGEVWIDTTFHAVAVECYRGNEPYRMIRVSNKTPSTHLIWSKIGVGTPALETAISQLRQQKSPLLFTTTSKPPAFQDSRELHY